MALADDLRQYVQDTFKRQWTSLDRTSVPAPEDIPLNNTAGHFSLATVLYADLAASTDMVLSKSWQFASEIYKNYLYCCSRMIRNEGGEITAYDGDRVMGVFIGDLQSSNAAKCGLRINWAVNEIINPAIKAQYPKSTFQMAQCVGIDVSEVYVSRTGVRGDNDLVWVGRAPNYAAKLNELSAEGATWITESVFKRLSNESKYSKGQLMWEERSWPKLPGITLYRSTWQWSL